MNILYHNFLSGIMPFHVLTCTSFHTCYVWKACSVTVLPASFGVNLSIQSSSVYLNCTIYENRNFILHILILQRYVSRFYCSGNSIVLLFAAKKRSWMTKGYRDVSGYSLHLELQVLNATNPSIAHSTFSSFTITMYVLFLHF